MGSWWTGVREALSSGGLSVVVKPERRAKHMPDSTPTPAPGEREAQQTIAGVQSLIDADVTRAQARAAWEEAQPKTLPDEALFGFDAGWIAALAPTASDAAVRALVDALDAYMARESGQNLNALTEARVAFATMEEGSDGS